jgi:hypothetical protein
MNDDVTFEIGGLTQIDAERLRDRSGVTLREATLPQGTYGEPVTFTIVVTAVGLSTLAAYLLRKHQGETFTDELIVRHPDGTIEHRRVHWEKSATEAPEPSIIKTIQGR